MNELQVVKARAANGVKRFHTSYRIRDESVGHHSANVCAILLYLNPECSRELLVYALMHDWPEEYTGDLPAPAKWQNPTLDRALHEAESHYWSHRLGAYPPELSNDELMYLKLADMIDLILSSYDEVHMGNQFACELAQNGEMYIANMDLPVFVRQKVQDLLECQG
jgi:5'-deoxynucleotidase YfbR-like HD superfamily hydrolase